MPENPTIMEMVAALEGPLSRRFDDRYVTRKECSSINDALHRELAAHARTDAAMEVRVSHIEKLAYLAVSGIGAQVVLAIWDMISRK